MTWDAFSARLGRRLDTGSGSRWARREGTLLKLDVSGFTRLSERLAVAQRTGAEELNAVLSDVFDGLISDMESYDGDVLQFGGDAIVVWFEDDGHRDRATAAAHAALDRMGRRPPEATPAGPVKLELSSGLASGQVLFGVVGRDHCDLVAVGPVVSAALRAESAAASGTLVAAPPVVMARADPPDDDVAAHLWTRPCAAPGWVPSRVRALLSDDGGMPGEVPGEHRASTAAFVALDGTDAAVAAGRDDEVAGTVARTVAAVEEACDATGVTWTAADLGADGIVLLLFAGAPLATEHDPDRMLRALHLALRRLEGLPIRAGAHHGRVFAGVLGGRRRRTWAAIGDTTNVAARLMGAAAPGSALVSADVWHGATGGAPEARRTLRTLSLKNRVEGITAVEVRAPDDLPEPGTQRPQPARGRLLGRESEVTEIARVLTGEQPAVLLVGPAGIGKSHLLAEALDRTDTTGRTVLRIRATPYDRANAYAGVRADAARLLGGDPARWRDLVDARDRDLVPLLGVVTGTEVAPSAATGALDPAFLADTRDRLAATALARAAGGPLVVVAEDAQLLDRASLGLLDAFAALPPEAGVSVVAALRALPGEDDSPSGWPAVPARWHVLQIRPLEDAQARRLVIAAAGETPVDDTTIDALVAEAGGNPLFVKELAALAVAGAGTDALPRTTEAVVAARIDRLPAQQRRLLREASVAGPAVDLDVLGRVLDDSALTRADAWSPLDAFVAVDGGTLRFTHDLYRRGAYDGLAVRRRRELHGRFADLLAGRGEEPAVLAVHAEAAGRLDDAADLALVAGRRAAGMRAWGDALRSLARALSCGTAAGRPTEWVAAAAEARAEAADLLGRYAEAEEALTLSLTSDEPAARGRRLVARAATRERQGRYDEALADLDLATAALPLGDADPGWPAVALRRYTSLFRLGRVQDALALARAVAGREGIQPADRALALLRMEMAATDLALPERDSYGQAALDAFEGLDADRDLANLLLNMSATAWDGGDGLLALRRCTAAADAFRAAGDLVGAAMAQNNAGEILCEQGQGDAAREIFEDARRVFRAAGHAFGAACTLSSLGRLAARRGAHGDALRLLHEAEAEFRRIDSPVLAADATVRRAEIALLQGAAGARSTVAAATAEVQTLDGVGGLAVTCQRYAGIAAWQAGDTATAVERLELARDRARRMSLLAEECLCLDALVALGPDPRVATWTRERDAIAARLGIVAFTRYPGPR